MQLIIHTKALGAALDRVKLRAPTTLPILSCLLLRAADGRLSLTATDLDIYIEASAACSISKDGALCVNATRLASIVARLGPCDIELSSDEKNNLTIQRGRSKIVLRGLPAVEFPPTPSTPDAKPFELPQDALKRALARVAPFMSDDTTRYDLCGVALLSEGGSMLAMTTDGRSLRTEKLECEFAGQIIVPDKAVMRLISLCSGEATAMCAYTASFISVNGGEWSLVAKLIEGNSPNYKQVIPDRMKLSATGDREGFLDALALASQMTSDATCSVKLSMGREATISANTPADGNSEIELPGFTTKEPIEIAINKDFLRDAIRSFPGDEITLQFIDAASPLKIDDATGGCVVMPMRIS